MLSIPVSVRIALLRSIRAKSRLSPSDPSSWMSAAERTLQRVDEIENATVRRDSRPLVMAIPSMPVRLSRPSAAIERAAPCLLIIVHRSEPKAPSRIDHAIVEAIAWLVPIDRDDRLEHSSAFVKMIEPGLKSGDETSAFCGKNEPNLLGSLPALPIAARRIGSPMASCSLCRRQTKAPGLAGPTGPSPSSAASFQATFGSFPISANRRRRNAHARHSASVVRSEERECRHVPRPRRRLMHCASTMAARPQACTISSVARSNVTGHNTINPDVVLPSSRAARVRPSIAALHVWYRTRSCSAGAS